MKRLICWIFGHDVEVYWKDGHMDAIECLRCGAVLQEGERL